MAFGKVVEMRKTLACDALYHDDHAGGHVEGFKDQIEGWCLRTKPRYPDAIPDPLECLWDVSAKIKSSVERVVRSTLDYVL